MLAGKVLSYVTRHNENGPYVVTGAITVWDDVNNPINRRRTYLKHVEWDQRTRIDVSLDVVKDTIVSFDVLYYRVHKN